MIDVIIRFVSLQHRLLPYFSYTTICIWRYLRNHQCHAADYYHKPPSSYSVHRPHHPQLIQESIINRKSTVHNFLTITIGVALIANMLS